MEPGRESWGEQLPLPVEVAGTASALVRKESFESGCFLGLGFDVTPASVVVVVVAKLDFVKLAAGLKLVAPAKSSRCRAFEPRAETAAVADIHLEKNYEMKMNTLKVNFNRTGQ